MATATKANHTRTEMTKGDNDETFMRRPVESAGRRRRGVMAQKRALIMPKKGKRKREVTTVQGEPSKKREYVGSPDISTPARKSRGSGAPRIMWKKATTNKKDTAQ